ncbi:MAG TPA: TolC family protein [Candidatus Sulfotelmatobacter sp.]|nr:TolC family protein [Candidatus Sulfotelmatobacter sp.]
MRAKILIVGMSFFGALTIARAQSDGQKPLHLTVQEAVQLALKHNHMVRIAGYKVEKSQHAKDVAKSAYFPAVENDSRLFKVTDTQFIQIAAGSLGTINGAPNPDQSVTINQGGRTFATSGTELVQPLTQLLTRVKPANDAARAELNATRANAHQTENEVALKVHELYYQVLIAQLHRSAAEARIKASQELESERIQQVKFGSSLEEDRIASSAQTLQAKQELLTTELALSDLTYQLDDALGLPLSTDLELDPSVPGVRDTCEREECIKVALESHPEILAAREQVRKASAGVQLSKADYIPNVSVFARYSYQSGVPFLARNFGSFGVHFTYELFDGGRRRAASQESSSQLALAKENLARVTEEVELAVQVAYNKLHRTREMVQVSEELLTLRSESRRVSGQELEKGEALSSQADSAIAQELDAKTQLLQSQLAYIQAHDEMKEAMGLTPE